jgi:hypothetical protein
MLSPLKSESTDSSPTYKMTAIILDESCGAPPFRYNKQAMRSAKGLNITSKVRHTPFAGEGEAHGLDLTTVDFSGNEQLACKWINLVKRSQYDCPKQSSFLAGPSTCKAIFHCPSLFSRNFPPSIVDRLLLARPETATSHPLS